MLNVAEVWGQEPTLQDGKWPVELTASPAELIEVSPGVFEWLRPMLEEP